MNQHIAFNPAALSAATAASQAVTTTEADVLEITDPKFLSKSQFTIFIDCALGDHTSLDFRYYLADGRDSGGSLIYYQVPIKDLATGVLIDRPTKVDSTSPAQAGTIRTEEDVPVGATKAFKVTVQGTGGSSGTLNSLRIWARDN